MRLYLKRIRQQQGRSADSIHKWILENKGKSVNVSAVETGHYWEVITPERAELLAEAYGTTAEKILRLEDEEGTWEGCKYIESTKPYDASIYDTALTDEEKNLVESLYPWAKRVVHYLQYREYRSYVSDGILTISDIEESAFLGLLRGAKALTSEKIRDAEYFATMTEEKLPSYTKWYLRRKMVNQVLVDMKKRFAEKRKSELYARHLEGGLSQGADDTDDSDLYELIPNKDLPTALYVESSVMLDTLYKHLTDQQIHICSLLIRGYVKQYLVQKKIATPRDIGIITFYLQQMVQFGKIKWQEKDYVSGAANVYYNFTINRWEVKLQKQRKIYRLGSYDDLNTALDVQIVANVLWSSDEFPAWYERHIVYNKELGQSVFTYPLDGDESEFEELSTRNATRIYAKQSDDEKVYGIQFNQKKNSYMVHYGTKRLWSVKTYDEAVALRKQAEAKAREGVLDEWIAERSAAWHQNVLERVSVYYDPRRDLYQVRKRFPKGKECYIGAYRTEAEANAIASQAKEHVIAGDFETWLAAYKAQKAAAQPRRAATEGSISSYLRNGAECFDVRFNFRYRTYHIGWFKSRAEAEQLLAEVNRHVDAGDFLEWQEQYKAEKEALKTLLPPTRVGFTKGSYRVYAYYSGKTYYVATFKNKNEAEKLAAEANTHAEFEDFIKWRDEYKNKTVKKQDTSYEYVIVDFSALAGGCYRVVGFAENGSSAPIYETTDVDEAYDFMNLANEHIESGDYCVWFDEYITMKG